MSFRFKCVTCGEVHEGMPTFGAKRPLAFYEIPEDEREARCQSSNDDCVIDEEWFFVRGCIDIPVHGTDDDFSWGVWVSLSEDNYLTWRDYFGKDQRSHVGPFFGWLNAWLKPYPSTVNLKTMLHLRDDGLRPYIEIEPSDHPLSVEQRTGISIERLSEIYSIMMHDHGE
ncbi:MAG: DUF2199 domain-containing protein [Kiloniellaceae bacterium]